MSGEKPTDDLYALVKNKLEEDGVLRQVRCMLQTSIVNLIKGVDEESGGAIVQRPVNVMDCGLARDVRIRLLNQLVLEYFKWCGYAYSAEMLARESDVENVVPARDCLEGMVGRHAGPGQLPILLEIIADLYERTKRKHGDV